MSTKKAKTTNLDFRLPKITIPTDVERKLPIPFNEVELVRNRKNEKLLFSFKFFDREHEAFNLAGSNKVCDNWFLCLFDILKDVSDLTRNELVVERKQHYDSHEHDWDKLIFKYPLDDGFLNQVECMQFRISQGRGRIHGFIVGNRFYVVWLDPHHNLYPNERFGGIKSFLKPLSCYEILYQETINLNQKLMDIRKKNNDLQSEFDNFLSDHDKTLSEKERLEELYNQLLGTVESKKNKQDKYNKKFKK